MNTSNLSKEELLPLVRTKLKELLVSHLALEDIKPEEIGDDEAIFGEGLGLDSLDGVEIVVLLQRSFGVNIKETEKGNDLFRTINTLSNYIVENSPHPLGVVPPEENK
ncbi:MAG: phosphopantetheine-binding protein [Verrucomicrobiota bacterium]|jgi:acyl carrier protein